MTTTASCIACQLHKPSWKYLYQTEGDIHVISAVVQRLNKEDGLHAAQLSDTGM